MQQCDNWNRLPLHYASYNLPKITTETLQHFNNSLTNDKYHAPDSALNKISHILITADIKKDEEGNNQFDDENCH